MWLESGGRQSARGIMIMLSISVGNMSITGYHHLLAGGEEEESDTEIRKRLRFRKHQEVEMRWISWQIPFVLIFFEAVWCLTYITYLLCLKSEGVSCARVISERVSEVTCLIRPPRPVPCPPVTDDPGTNYRQHCHLRIPGPPPPPGFPNPWTSVTSVLTTSQIPCILFLFVLNLYFIEALVFDKTFSE